MPGGINSATIIKGNCLKTKKWSKGANPSAPPSRQQTQATNPNVTMISEDQLNSLKAQYDMPATKTHLPQQQRLDGGVWGPPPGPPIWKATNQMLKVSQLIHQKEQNLPEIQEDAKVLALGDSIFKTGYVVEISDELGIQIELVSPYRNLVHNVKK